MPYAPAVVVILRVLELVAAVLADDLSFIDLSFFPFFGEEFQDYSVVFLNFLYISRAGA